MQGQSLVCIAIVFWEFMSGAFAIVFVRFGKFASRCSVAARDVIGRGRVAALHKRRGRRRRNKGFSVLGDAREDGWRWLFSRSLRLSIVPSLVSFCVICPLWRILPMKNWHGGVESVYCNSLNAAFFTRTEHVQ